MEKKHSLELDKSTKELIEEAFADRKCICGKPATRIVGEKFLCPHCATPYNSEKKRESDAITIRQVQVQVRRSNHLKDDEYW